MTDTPRTRDELLTDFADQQNHGITPQKMRNFVESLPVGGPGLEHVAGFGGDAATIDYPTGLDVPDSTNIYVPWSNAGNPGLEYDPQGWFQFDDDYPSPDWYGETVPAGSWVLLPEGVFQFSAYAAWDGNQVGRRSFFAMDTCDNRTGDVVPQLDPWAWDPLYNTYNAIGVHQSPTAFGLFGSFGYHMVSGMIRVIAATAPVAFSNAVFQTSGGTRKLLAAGIGIMQLSEKG